MQEILFTIILGVISSSIYDYVKNIYMERKNNIEENTITYSNRYIRAVIRQFYICLPMGIILLFFSNRSNNFFNVARLVFAGLFFMFSIFAFMCLIDVLKQFKNNNDSKSN